MHSVRACACVSVRRAARTCVCAATCVSVSVSCVCVSQCGRNELGSQFPLLTLAYPHKVISSSHSVGYARRAHTHTQTHCTHIHTRYPHTVQFLDSEPTGLKVDIARF